MKYAKRLGWKSGVLLFVSVLLVGALGMAGGVFQGEVGADPDGELATQWKKTFGGTDHDWAKSVHQTSDGGYIIVGMTKSFGDENGDVWLVKTDPDGNKLWDRTFGGPNREFGTSVHQTSDGGYVIAGVRRIGSYQNYERNGLLIKTNSSGKKVWSKTFPGIKADGFHSVQQTSDGGYIVGGYKGAFSSTGNWGDIWLIKTDSSGKMIWENTFDNGRGADTCRSAQQTLDGGYIAAGPTQFGPAGGRDIWLIKTGTDGNKVWDRTFGGAANDRGRSVQQTSDGGYIIAGFTESFGAGKGDIYVIKTDIGGNKMWDNTFGGGDMDKGRSVQQTSDGGYVIAGSTKSFGGGNGDIYVIKTDTDGNKVWDKTFGAEARDSGNSVRQTSDGGYILAGATKSYGAGNSDVWLIKMGKKGKGTIEGQVHLQGRTDHSGIKVTANGLEKTTDEEGNFAFADIPAGTYTLTASMPCYLPAEKDIAVNPGETNDIGKVTLLAGDINNDGIIDIYDLTLMGKNFGKTQSP